MTTHESFPAQILEFGTSIFQDIGESQPGAFNKNYWNGRLMEWSMRHPELKVNLFRLVDVLPSLRSSQAIASHVREYLADAGGAIHPLFRWALTVRPGSLRGTVTSIAVKTSVQQMAKQFIAGTTAEDALPALRKIRKRRLAFTVDLLGEFSVSEREALAYQQRYLDALDEMGRSVPGWPESKPLVNNHAGELSPMCVSVKLSALYSQCTPLNFARSVDILSDRLSAIVEKADRIGALLYVDAEDSANNPIIYATFKRVFGEGRWRSFRYPGIVIQAYAKNGEETVRDMLNFAEKRGAPIAIRLVKGAYWDYETITSRLNNWESPLFRQKESTDASYEHLSRLLIDNHHLCLPAFGSHNIRSLAQACCYARQQGLELHQYELQMLFGMADPIADAFARRGYLVRLYVPLGEMLPGMGYLVRRLLENTSNESFLRHTFFDQTQVADLLREPRQGNEPA